MSEHQIIEQKPKKTKTGASSNKNTDALPKVPPFPTGEKASGSQDKPKNNNPESEHERKGKPGRPRNNQGPKPNNQGPPPVRKEIEKHQKQKQKQPQHQTQNMTLTLIIILIFSFGKIRLSQK